MEEYQREGLVDPIEDNSSRKQKDMPNWGRKRRKNKALEKEKEIVICPVCLEGVREKSILDTKLATIESILFVEGAR